MKTIIGTLSLCNFINSPTIPMETKAALFACLGLPAPSSLPTRTPPVIDIPNGV